MKKLALPLTIVALGTFTYACSGGGGGNGAEPCCGATGETVPPSSSFGGGAPVRHAQVVVFDTSTSAVCPTINADGLDLTMIQLDAASPARRVNDDGTFDLEIDEDFEDQQLFVRIFDGADNTLSRGMGALSRRSAPGATIPVAPILFDASTFGESTVEGVIACLFQTAAVPADQFQNMTFTDVRSFVNEDMARALQSGGEGGIHNTAKSYRHGINGLFNMLVATNGTLAEDFHRLRRDAEEFADRCKLRDESSPAACTSQNDSRIRARIGDSYRFWYLVRNARDPQYDIVWDVEGAAVDPATRRTQAFAEDSLIELLQIDGNNVLDTSNATQVAAYRTNQLLRFEIATFALRKAFTCYGSALGPDANGDCTDGILDTSLDVTGSVVYPSFDDSVAALQAALVSPGSVQDMKDAWGDFARNVAFNFGLQAKPGTYTDQGGNVYSDAVQNALSQSVAAHFDFILDGSAHQVESRNIDWTNEALRARLYDASNTETSAEGIYPAIASAAFGLPGENDPDVVADVLFYSHLNVRP